jgi:3-deoxy-D-manno-octulosonic-acid transferase
MLRAIYSFFMVLLSPYLLFRLWWKGRKLPAYRERIAERFALSKPKPADIWVHAVSLGEVIAASPMIEALLQLNYSVMVTTMTPSGSLQVKKRFSDSVRHQYIPYDLSWTMASFCRNLKPKLGIVMETELWPNLVYQARAASIPLILANARLSHRSYQGYARFGFFFKPILNQFSWILAQAQEDADRFTALGASKVQVLGNMKFDLQKTKQDHPVFHDLQAQWGEKRIILIAASTHEDEESQLLNQLRRLQAGIPELLLLIAPRHPERFQTIYDASMQMGFKTAKRSLPKTISVDTEVVIIDSIGELLGFYALSDYAFVGGSLVPIGGHNIMEPISCKVPVFSGPYVFNMQAICNAFQEASGIILIHSADELAPSLIKLHQDKKAKAQLIDNANTVFLAHQGALARHLTEIKAVLAADSIV